MCRSVRVSINGKEGFFIDTLDTWLDPPEEIAKNYPHKYYLRHSDNNWVKPVTVEKNPVFVNYFGVVYTDRPVLKGKATFTRVKKWEVKMKT